MTGCVPPFYPHRHLYSHFVYSSVSNPILSEVRSLSLSCFFCQSADLFPGHLRPRQILAQKFVKANQDALFVYWFKTLDANQSRVKNATVDGLGGNLSSKPSGSKESGSWCYVIHGVKPVGKVLGQKVPKSGRKEWFEIPSELAHHEGPTNFGFLIPSRFSKQGFDDEIDTSRVRQLILDWLH